VKDYEPRIALYAGQDGLDLYRRIMEKVGQFLKPDGILLLEIGYQQGPAVQALLEQTGVFAQIRIDKDLQSHDRVVAAVRVGAG
jgi:release factor glutamine methyltransferase